MYTGGKKNKEKAGVEKDYSMYSTGRILREVEWYTHSPPLKELFSSSIPKLFSIIRSSHRHSELYSSPCLGFPLMTFEQ